MKIIKKDLRKGFLTVKSENSDDNWILQQVIDPHDEVKGSTERKIKIGDASTDRNVKVVRKKVKLSIKVEKTGIEEGRLKILGVITAGPEDVARGEHHSIKVSAEDIITIVKEEWPNYQYERIKDACKADNKQIILLVFDRDEAHFARLKGQGYEILSSFKGDVAKKDDSHVSSNTFYEDIVRKLEEYDKTGMDAAIVASPGFFKDDLLERIPQELSKKVTAATVSAASQRALSELLKRPELKSVLQENRARKELELTENILKAISSEEACYGLDETKEKAMQGAVKELMVSYTFLEREKEKGNYEDVESVMKTVEKTSGKVHIISTQEARETIDSLSGIAGILRWKSQL